MRPYRRLVVLVCLLLAACQPATAIDREPVQGQTLRINVGSGIGYAPLVVMQTRRLLERRVPGLGVEWKAIPSAEAVHDALLTGGLDLVTGPPTAFLLTREGGAPVRVLAGVAQVPFGLVAGRDGVASLRDLGPGDRIAVPAIGGLEHTVLRMAALRELGDPRALDPLVVEAPHPEATAALVQRRGITAHLAVPPFLEAELAVPGTRQILAGPDLSGDALTAVVAYTTPTLRDRHARLVDVFVDALREAADVVARERGMVARSIAERDGLDLPAGAIERAFERPGLAFSTQVRGLSRVATIMELTGQLRRGNAGHGDFAFEGVDAS